VAGGALVLALAIIVVVVVVAVVGVGGGGGRGSTSELVYDSLLAMEVCLCHAVIAS
jgi:hypothetical protein